MYQQPFLIFALFTTFSMTGYADQKSEIAAEYKNFRQIEARFFSAKITKENFAGQATSMISALNTSFEKVKVIEARSEDIVLSVEGNQMAYDLEILSPLIDLAKVGITPKTCKEAVHDNQFNKAKDSDAKEITDLLKKICT